MLRDKDSLFLILSDTLNSLKMVYIFLPDLLGDFDNTLVIRVWHLFFKEKGEGG